MKPRREIETMARGVCVKNGRLLVCRTKGADNTYLPGGHIDFREKARDALRREIAEEMGQMAKVGRFLGGVEHTFVQRGERHCEINLVFEMKIPGIRWSRRPESKEDHIEFLWLEMKSLGRTDLEPCVLRRALGGWLKAGRGVERWAGTYP